MSRYEFRVILLLDECFPENDEERVRERLEDALRSEGFDFERDSLSLDEPLLPAEPPKEPR